VIDVSSILNSVLAARDRTLDDSLVKDGTRVTVKSFDLELGATFGTNDYVLEVE